MPDAESDLVSNPDLGTRIGSVMFVNVPTPRMSWISNLPFTAFGKTALRSGNATSPHLLACLTDHRFVTCLACSKEFLGAWAPRKQCI